MKYLKKVNELNAETYKNAAKKVKDMGQMKTYQDLMKMYRFRSMSQENRIKQTLIEQNSFKMYIEEVLYEGDIHSVEGKIIDVNIAEIDVPEDDLCFFFLGADLEQFRKEIDHQHPNEAILLNCILTNDNGKPEFEFTHNKNKFTSRKEFNVFMAILEKYYQIEDRNTVAKMMGKLNDTKVPDMKNGDFNEFINNNFGSFKEFKSKVQPRKYYDRF